jgi:hypothetical protein
MSNIISDRASGNGAVVVTSSMHVLRAIVESAGTMHAVAVHTVTVHSMSSVVTLNSMAHTVRAATEGSPASLVSEDSIDEFGTRHVVLEGSVAVEGNVVEAEVPDGSKGHPVGRESEDGTNDGTSKDIVEVVVLVDGKGTSDQDSTEDRGVSSDELPHGRVVVGEDLELGVEVQVQVDKASESSSGVTTGHRLKSIVDLSLVTSADIGGEVELEISLVVVSTHGTSTLHIRLADNEEVRSEATDEPLDEDLEDSGGDKRVEKTDGGIVEVPEAANADLHASEDEDRDQSSKHGGSPDGNDLASHGVSILGPDNFAVVEGNGEGSHRSRLSKVDTEANSTHDSHGDNVEPCMLDPLSERGLARHGKRIVVSLLATTHLGLVPIPVGSLVFAREDTHVVGNVFNDIGVCC